MWDSTYQISQGKKLRNVAQDLACKERHLVESSSIKLSVLQTELDVKIQHITHTYKQDLFIMTLGGGCFLSFWFFKFVIIKYYKNRLHCKIIWFTIVLLYIEVNSKTLRHHLQCKCNVIHLVLFLTSKNTHAENGKVFQSGHYMPLVTGRNG